MYLISIRNYTILFALLYSISGFCQNDAKTEALNGYVDFLNESVHGLTVAHILFVNYNKDLNKYVDLASHKLNTHITNQELGESIFDNPDINTSDNNASAISLSKSTKEASQILQASSASNFNQLVSQIVGILNKINALRFEIETYISSSDMNVKENIYKTYELLEKAVSYFKEYNQLHDKLARGLRKSLDYEYEPISFLLYEIHNASISLIKDLRIDNVDKLDGYISRILGAVDKLNSNPLGLDNNQKRIVSEITKQVKGMTSFVNSKLSGGEIPESYLLYGTNYYIHNHLLLSYFNSISPGFVSKMNQLSKSINETYLSYDDRPIIFKVTYPEKMQEIEAIATKKVTGLARKPIDSPKMPEVYTAPVVPEKDYVDLEFYDPNLFDRDSISVSFNDEWILEDYKLVGEPKKIRLEIDPLKGNSVFIVAKNEGIIAPNTVGFKYRVNSKGRKTTVEKNLNMGTGYECILTIDGLGGFSDKY